MKPLARTLAGMGIAYSKGNETGVPVIDETSCSVCGECAEICPVGCLEVRSGRIAVVKDAHFGCIACGHCMMVCPLESIQVTGRGIEECVFQDTPPKESRASAAQLEALFASRRSTRRFLDREVSRDDIDKIVKAAAQAPMGIPPSEVGVAVFYGKRAVRELAWDAIDAYGRMMSIFANPAVRILTRLLGGKALYDRLYTMLVPLGAELASGKRNNRDLALYDEPAALLFHYSPYTDACDAHIACTYAMLEAESLGLGTAMIGCVPPPLARSKKLLEKYKLAGHKPALVLIIGNPAKEFRRSIQRRFCSVDWID